MKKPLILFTALIFVHVAQAQLLPPGACTNCPPGTNYGQVTYDPKPIYTTNLAIRYSSIRDHQLIATNHGWVINSSNNTMMPSGLIWVNQADNSNAWTIGLAVTNTDPGYVYGVYRRDVLLGADILVSTNFVGVSNAEYTVYDTAPLSKMQAFYIAKREPGFVRYVSSFNGSNGGNTNDCPGPYIGAGNIAKNDVEWGWIPDTNNFAVFKAVAFGRPDARVTYINRSGTQYGCDVGSVTIPLPLPDHPTYRFSIFFRSNLPTPPFPVWLQGMQD